MRPRRDLTQNSGRDRESRCVFLRDPRREPTFNQEIYRIFGNFLLKTNHPDQDETKTRLSKN